MRLKECGGGVVNRVCVCVCDYDRTCPPLYLPLPFSFFLLLLSLSITLRFVARVLASIGLDFLIMTPHTSCCQFKNGVE